MMAFEKDISVCNKDEKLAEHGYLASRTWTAGEERYGNNCRAVRVMTT
jgi:hypothetical protein